jgi:hypothetical protein
LPYFLYQRILREASFGAGLVTKQVIPHQWKKLNHLASALTIINHERGCALQKKIEIKEQI